MRVLLESLAHSKAPMLRVVLYKTSESHEKEMLQGREDSHAARFEAKTVPLDEKDNECRGGRMENAMCPRWTNLAPCAYASPSMHNY